MKLKPEDQLQTEFFTENTESLITAVDEYAKTIKPYQRVPNSNRHITDVVEQKRQQALEANTNVCLVLHQAFPPYNANPTVETDPTTFNAHAAINAAKTSAMSPDIETRKAGLELALAVFGTFSFLSVQEAEYVNEPKTYDHTIYMHMMAQELPVIRSYFESTNNEPLMEGFRTDLLEHLYQMANSDSYHIVYFTKLADYLENPVINQPTRTIGEQTFPNNTDRVPMISALKSALYAVYAAKKDDQTFKQSVQILKKLLHTN